MAFPAATTAISADSLAENHHRFRCCLPRDAASTITPRGFDKVFPGTDHLPTPLCKFCSASAELSRLSLRGSLDTTGLATRAADTGHWTSVTPSSHRMSATCERATDALLFGARTRPDPLWLATVQQQCASHAEHSEQQQLQQLACCMHPSSANIKHGPHTIPDARFRWSDP